MALLAAARAALAGLQQTRDPACAWCLVDDEASQQRYVYAGGPLFPAHDEITLQDVPMTVADLCVMIATQQQLILTSGEPVIAENLFVRRIRPKYAALASEAHTTVFDRKSILGLYAAIYSDADSSGIIHPSSVRLITDINISAVPDLLKSGGIPLIVKLTQDSNKDVFFDLHEYDRRRDVSSYYSTLHEFLASRELDDKKDNQEYLSYYSHGANFLTEVDSAIEHASKHLEFLTPFLADTSTSPTVMSSKTSEEHAGVPSGFSLDQAISSIKKCSELDQRVATNPQLTTETDSSDQKLIYSGRLSVLSSRVTSHVQVFPKTLEIEKAQITSFMHRSTFVVNKDFFSARGLRILNTIHDIARSMNTYKPSLFCSTVYLSSLYASLVPTAYLSKLLRTFSKYCTTTTRKDPTDTIRVVAAKIQRPVTFISANSLHYAKFIAPFIRNNIPIVADSTLRQILSALYHKPPDSHAEPSERRTEVKQGLQQRISKSSPRYILIPSAYSSCVVNERNILYLFVGGEFKPLNRLEKVKDYRRPQYSYVHQKIKNKEVEAANFSLNKDKLSFAADDIVLSYKARTLIFTSDVGKVTEQEWESGAVLCVVLEKQSSQFNRIRVNKSSEDKLAYVLSKSLGVYFYMKGEEAAPPYYKGDNIFSVQLSSIDSGAVHVQMKTLWALIENRLG
ncbi:Hypothetical protein GLP15_3539 [Giardia lamblia P15]|uniref:Cell division control protein 73 C-terminal domain-containing protein n=1 Tax=Giardia intestinalis (strain P15) TaxID=658858 RepID=E1F7G4_GIAIA|nr:Hypothetical protein GLP15_3539 [Giardia lamblia P15]